MFSGVITFEKFWIYANEKQINIYFQFFVSPFLILKVEEKKKSKSAQSEPN